MRTKNNKKLFLKKRKLIRSKRPKDTWQNQTWISLQKPRPIESDLQTRFSTTPPRESPTTEEHWKKSNHDDVLCFVKSFR